MLYRTFEDDWELVFLRVRMRICDAGALGNPRNLGGDGWELPDAKKC